MSASIEVRRIDEVRCIIPRDARPGMRVEGRVYADEVLMRSILDDNALEQVANVAFLPGIRGASLAMPDIHWGYGFPIGGVAAMDMEEGVVSPGGIGFDINCGVRLIRTDLTFEEVHAQLPDIGEEMFRSVPSGVGSRGRLDITSGDLDRLLTEGVNWCIENGFGREEDARCTEEGGCMRDADPGHVSSRAKKRGSTQLGTLGSGNHFLEVQRVDRVYEEGVAKRFGITGEGQVVVMVHTGSRGFGHQVATDHIDRMLGLARKFGFTFRPTSDPGEIYLPDRQLACSPIPSREGEEYLRAMWCAANFGWANRQVITHRVRAAFEKVLGMSAADLGMDLVYDVAHNIAKVEEYVVEGRRSRLLVHRKGATRAFPPGHEDLPSVYRGSGQPVIIPGDMGSASYLLAGSERVLEESFGTTCHGAGRVMSRSKARRLFTKRGVTEMMGRRGIHIRAASKDGIVEEAPGVYKDIDAVVDVCSRAGMVRRVARLVPVAVVKG